MCFLKPVKKLIVPNKKCLTQYFLKREIKTLLNLCFPVIKLNLSNTSWSCTWTKFSIHVSKWDFKICVLRATSDLLQHQYIIPLEYKCFSRKKNPCISPNVIHWGFSCYAQWFKTNIFWWSWSWQHHSAHARGIKMSWFMTGMSNRKQTNIYNSKPHKCAVT